MSRRNYLTPHHRISTPVILTSSINLFIRTGPSGSIMLVRAKKDGRPLRAVPWNEVLVNPFTETALPLETKMVTVDLSFGGIEATSEGKRIPVNISLFVSIVNYSRRSTHIDIDRAIRTSEEEVRACLAEGMRPLLQEAGEKWSPEAFRDGPAALIDWLVRTTDARLRHTGWFVNAVTIKEVTDDNHYFDILDFPRYLEGMRQGLRKAGIDPGPVPINPLTPEGLGAEYQRLKLLWAQTVDGASAPSSAIPAGDGNG